MLTIMLELRRQLKCGVAILGGGGDGGGGGGGFASPSRFVKFANVASSRKSRLKRGNRPKYVLGARDTNL